MVHNDKYNCSNKIIVRQSLNVLYSEHTVGQCNNWWISFRIRVLELKNKWKNHAFLNSLKCCTNHFIMHIGDKFFQFKTCTRFFWLLFNRNAIEIWSFWFPKHQMNESLWNRKFRRSIPKHLKFFIITFKDQNVISKKDVWFWYFDWLFKMKKY